MRNPVLFALASGGGGSNITTTVTDWQQILSDITGQYSVANIVAVMSQIILAGIGFVFLWWGARKAYRALMSAVRRGKTGF